MKKTLLLFSLFCCLLAGSTMAQTINSFTPLSAKPGDAVTITGTDFNTTFANNIVFFGATKATVTGASTTSITAIVPTGATYAPITVLNSETGKTAYSRANFNPIFVPSKQGFTTSDFLDKLDIIITGSPKTVAIGDLDGDGKPDLAVGNQSRSSFISKISLFRNISTSGSITTSSFANAVDITVGLRPTSLAVNDIDGDGKLDLVFITEDDKVSVLRNNSSTGLTTNSFEGPVNFDLTQSAFGSVAIGDLNSDGKPDLAVTNFTSGVISIFINQSTKGSITTNSFAPKINFNVGTLPTTVKIGDLDGDSKPDLAVANRGSNNISVLLNTTINASSTTFAPKSDFAVGTSPGFLTIGDLDGDTKLDIVVANYDSDNISVLHNTTPSESIGSVSFAQNIDYPIGPEPSSIAIGDVNGNGKPDLVVATNRYEITYEYNEFDFDAPPREILTAKNNISVLLNTSSSGSWGVNSLATQINFTARNIPTSLVIGDLDGDNLPDLVAVNSGTGDISILRNADVVMPLITTSAISGDFASCEGTVSPPQTFTVSGTNLTANVVVTAPTGYEVSTASSSGFASSAILTQTGGRVNSTTIYARLTNTVTGTPVGNITLTSADATTKNVAVSGTVNALPAITLGSVSNVTTTATTFSLPYTATTGSPDQYSITAGTPNAMPGFTTVSNASLAVSPLSVTIPASTANTYNFVATVRNTTTGCVSANNNFTATVNIDPNSLFITRWDLSKSTGSGANQISFGVETAGTVNYTWTTVPAGTTGSGTFSGTTATITDLPENAIIDLSISPTNFQRININFGTDRGRLTELKQWGTVAWTSMQSALAGCNNFTLTAMDVPNLAGVTNMSFMFLGCSAYNQPLPATFNTVAVTNMSSMFEGCTAYNQPLPASFNTAAVTNMSFMFFGCTAYNQPLPASFNTAEVTNMSAMFQFCNAYNQPLPTSFNTAAVTNMGFMFFGCSAYNQPLPASFNTAKVTNMEGLFYGCTAYDQPLPASFNTTEVTNMSATFQLCSAYNQPLPASFNTAAVTNMSYMFFNCTAYNQPLPASFNTTKVTDMESLFEDCTAFNQNVGSFDITTATKMSNIFKGSGISIANYDAILTAWNAGGYTNKNLGDASPLKYCASAADRNTLITTKGWTITGDKGCTTTTLVSSQNPSPSGGNVIFAATVSPSTATGTVTFKNGTTTLGTIALTAGVATYSTTTLPVATHVITAVYDGDATNATSTSAEINQVVNCALATSPGNVDITWTGSESTDWNNACNWSPAWVPDVTNARAMIPNTANQPVISGPIPDVNSAYVIDGGLLTINNGATLNIRENGGINKGIRIDGGLLINNGNINIESTTNTAITGAIYLSTFTTSGNTSNFTNNGTVKINSVNGAIGVGDASAALVTNNGIINVINGIGVEVTSPTDGLVFNNAGTINYNGTALALSLQGSSSFTNTGIININSGTGISKTASVPLNNSDCGKIVMTTGTYDNGGGTTTNSGLIQMPNNFDYTNTGTFTNNGIVKVNTATGITNNNVIVSNTCPTFTLGGNVNFTISGIFTNAGATNSAGTYTQVDNVFTAKNSLKSGSQTLHAQLTNGACVYVVPFTFNNEQPTAVSISLTTACAGTSVNLSATCASGTPTWYDIATDGTALGTGSSFSYSPPVGSNQNFYAACETTNCKSGRTVTSNSVTVNPNPTAFASSNSPVCAGSAINLFSGKSGKDKDPGIRVAGAEPAQTYAWTGPNSFTSDLENPSIPSATVLASGTYQVIVTSFEGCTATSTTEVTVKPSPTMPTISGNAEICEGETTNLTANSTGIIGDMPLVYEWSSNATGSNIQVSPLVTTTYTVTATVDGCTSPASAVFTLTVNPKPAVPTITADNMAICKGSNVILTGNCATAGASFRWSTPGFVQNGVNALPATSTQTVSAPGVYKGLCELDKGCLSTEVSITITEASNCNGQNFITILPEKPIICPNSSITLTASGCSGTLTWLSSGGNQTGTSVLVSPTATTTYLVTCSTGGSTTVDVRVTPQNVVVSNNITTGKEQLKATDTITSDKKIGDANFTPAPNVIYEAGKSITLLPGFTAERWSTFKAEIKTCNQQIK